MKLSYDSRAGATYVTLRKLKPGEFVDKTLQSGAYYIDYDKDGQILGIEYLNTPTIEVDGTEVKLR